MTGGWVTVLMGHTLVMFWSTRLHRLVAALPVSAHAPGQLSSRDAVRQAVVRELDARWHGLWGSFGMAVILFGFGALLSWRRWDEQATSAVALMSAGALLWLVHRQRVLQWRNELGRYCDWLSAWDQAVVALGLLASVMVPEGPWWWPVPMLAASIWGVFKLWANAQAHWAHWHFVSARKALRERRRARKA